MEIIDTKDTIQLFDREDDQKVDSVSVDNHECTTRNEETQFPICISFKSIALVTATCQISALIFCLTWSIKFNFHESTATHCHVANFLPSLSATLEFTPQRDVWIASIGIFGGLRYFIAYLYFKLIFDSKLLLILHWIEITALLGLSIVDSLKYFAFHATCVGIFLFTTVAHEFMVCLNITKPREIKISEQTSNVLAKTKTFKTKIAIINFITLSIALYLYDYHNKYCKSGVYSMFSALEYFVIVFNVIYHLQAYHDMSEYSLVVLRHGVYVKESSRKIH